MELPKGKNSSKQEHLIVTGFTFPSSLEDIVLLNAVMENRAGEGISGTLILHPNKLILTLDGHEPLELSEGDLIALIYAFKHALEQREHIVRTYHELRDLLGAETAAAALRDNYRKDPPHKPDRS